MPSILVNKGSSAHACLHLPCLFWQFAEAFAIVGREPAQMAEAELERGVGNVGTRMREQAFACCVQADVAQQVHWCDAMMLMAKRVQGAHADACRPGQIGQ